jgi:hypothetical protein
MRAALHRLLVCLTAFAFIAAMSIQAIPSAEALGLSGLTDATQADMPCPRMAVEHTDRGVPIPMPCKGIMPDCVKQMGCVGSPNLAPRSADLQGPVSYRDVVYASQDETGPDRSIKPDLFPPIAS